jgi:hypothetical protein
VVDGQEVAIPIQFKQHATEIAHILKIDIGSTKNERMFQLQKLEEDR